MNDKLVCVFDSFDAALSAAIDSLCEDKAEVAGKLEMDTAEFLHLVDNAARGSL